MDSFDDFFENTGIEKDSFQGAKTKALNFGQRFKSTFTPELKSQVSEAKQRAKRLNAKPSVIKNVPNAILYFSLLVISGFILKRIFTKS